jgi:hypothetical protein
MGASYADKLRDVRWQKKRLQVLDSSKWKCEHCHDSSNQLHVHHYWYEPGKSPWEYDDKCYAALCDKCHERWHISKAHIDRLVSFAPGGNLASIQGLIHGHICAQHCVDFTIEPDADLEYITGFVRGFWPPIEYVFPILSKCVEQTSEDSPRFFSQIVREVVTTEEGCIAAWLRNVERKDAT